MAAYVGAVAAQPNTLSAGIINVMMTSIHGGGAIKQQEMYH